MLELLPSSHPIGFDALLPANTITINQQRILKSSVVQTNERGATGGAVGNVRELKRSDEVDYVQSFLSALLPIRYPPHLYTLLLSSPTSLCLLSSSRGRKGDQIPGDSDSTKTECLTGVVAATLHPSLEGSRTSRIYIIALAIAERDRQKGLGRALFHGVIDSLLDRSMGGGKVWVSLHMRSDDMIAKGFYEAMGLEERARLRGYYSKSGGGEGGGEAIEMAGLIWR